MSNETKEQKRQDQIDRALAAFDEVEALPPLTSGCWFDVKTRRIVIEFTAGDEYRFPPEWAQGLGEATDEQLSNIEIFPSGCGLRWPDLDVDLSVSFIMEGVFGNREWMANIAAKGGRSTSEAKKAAARVNGKKGGRPKKQKASA